MKKSEPLVVNSPNVRDVEVGTGSSGDDNNTFGNIIPIPLDIETQMIDSFSIEDCMVGDVSQSWPRPVIQKSASMPISDETRLANNASARKYRARKRQEMENLRERCKAYESHNMELQIMLQKSMKKIDELETQIRKLRESSKQ